MADICMGMLVNTRKSGALAMARFLMDWGKAHGVCFTLPPHEASVLGIQGVDDDEWRKTVSVAIVIGGDGTFLRAARYVMGAPVSLYGINLGHLGFLASGKAEEAEKDKSILAGEYTLQPHAFLRVKFTEKKEHSHPLRSERSGVAKGAMARVMHIEVGICGKT